MRWRGDQGQRVNAIQEASRSLERFLPCPARTQTSAARYPNTTYLWRWPVSVVTAEGWRGNGCFTQLWGAQFGLHFTNAPPHTHTHGLSRPTNSFWLQFLVSSGLGNSG